MHKASILIIDDDEDDRIVYRRYLKKNNEIEFHFYEATNGEDAIKIYEEENIDCILLDYLLPDIAGVDLIKKLESDGSNHLLPLVAITGEGNEEIAAQFIKNGAKEYLSKSKVSSHSLMRAIVNAMEKAKLNKKIASQQKEIEAFSNRVAHDLRGTVGVIQGLSQVGMEMDEVEELKKIHERIFNTSIKAGRVIQGIFELCNLTGKDATFEPCSLNEIIKNAVDELEENDLNIEIDCPHSLIGSKNMLPRVFDNLISNSIKFTQEIREPIIKVKSEEREGVLRVIYEDNGPGIPKKHRIKIFNAFERLHGESIEGLGIGLNIVKKIIEIHNAEISIEDAENLEGCAFIIDFPIIS
jgi:signal transduction histidine kinase